MQKVRIFDDLFFSELARFRLEQLDVVHITCYSQFCLLCLFPLVSFLSKVIYPCIFQRGFG